MNDQCIFEREKEFCELFKINQQNKSVYILSNVSSEGMVTWVNFDKEDSWDSRHGEIILSTLIKNFKLDKIGYKPKPNVLR